ncbi:MAG: CheB methylesterase domain-containing protein [Vicinamibacterales bacterium]
MGVRRLIAVGASVGGNRAIESLLMRLPADTPPILIVQHTLPDFTGRFASRLNEVSPMRVVEATDGQVIVPGAAYIAPWHAHLTVTQLPHGLHTALIRTPRVQFHRPSVDALFLSLVGLRDVDVVAVILTGMGRDGAEGMLALRRSGARTIVQDEKSSMVFGMPKEAIERGAAEQVSSLDELPQRILRLVLQGAGKRTAAGVKRRRPEGDLGIERAISRRRDATLPSGRHTRRTS